MPRTPFLLAAFLMISPLALPSSAQDAPDVATLQKDMFSDEAATREAAEGQLRTLAEAGNAEAAGILSRDYDKKGDRQAAIDILGAAVAAGDIPSIQRLTWLLRETNADEARIREVQRIGWQAGDVLSGISHGRNLVGNGDPESIRAAREVFEAASQMPGFTAWSDLARMRRNGEGGAVDPEGAFEATRKSAETGNAWSALHLARMLLNGDGTTADSAEALRNFELALAGEGDVVETARRDLAAGHLYRKFGTLSDPGAGVDLAADGVAAGDMRMVRIAVTMPEAKGATGRKAEALRKKAIAIATDAATAGDETAVRSLFDYWHKQAVRSPDAGRKTAEIVEAHRALLDRPRLVRHELVATAPLIRGPEARAEEVRKLETLEGKDYTAALLDLRPHRHLYLQAIQSRLANRGFDPGVVDGLLGPRTRSAIDAFCKTYGVEAECRNGPRSWQLGKVVGEYLNPADDAKEP